MAKFQYQIVANDVNEKEKIAKQTVLRGEIEGAIVDVGVDVGAIASSLPGEVVQISIDIIPDNVQ